jgi:predicted alpha/beta-hydrolase family hydrolase
LECGDVSPLYTRRALFGILPWRRVANRRKKAATRRRTPKAAGAIRKIIRICGVRGLVVTKAEEMSFVATPERGKVSALLIRPERATHLLVLGHGASTDMRHATLQKIAERMAEAGIATMRYNFPYMEHHKGRDSREVCTATVRSAVAAAHAAAPDLPTLAGGHSFGGRMTSTATSEAPLDNVVGLVFCSFPLHQPGKPDTKRAEHLSAVGVPMLFLSGTRDELASLHLLESVCNNLGSRAVLHLLDTSDHGFRILKRTRSSDEDVFDEMARITAAWASNLK